MTEATDELRTAIFEAIANRLGEHPKSRNHEIADSGEYETRLGAFDVEVLAEWIAPAILAVVAEARTEQREQDAERLDRVGYGKAAKVLRGVGNQSAELESEPLPFKSTPENLNAGVGNQNAEPEAQWEYGVRAEGDEEPYSDISDDPETCLEGSPYEGDVLVRRRKAGLWLPADQKGTEQ